MILPVNDLDASLKFYCGLLGFKRDGTQGPFDVVRVSESFLLLLAAFSNDGGFHLAFTFSQPTFQEIMDRIRSRSIEFGDQFDNTTNGLGPSPQVGATGEEKGIYTYDPTRHLLELRCTPSTRPEQ